MCAATVVLFGATGAGKTTTAQVLSKQYGWSTLDIDQAIEAEQGRPIADLIRVEGEQYFRDLEAQAIEKALKEAYDAISIGAGAVMSAKVRESIQASNALPILLDLSAECASDRVLRDHLSGVQIRPMVAGVLEGKTQAEAQHSLHKRISELGASRMETYRQSSRIRIVTEFADASTIARLVVALRGLSAIGPKLLISPQQLPGYAVSTVWTCEAGGAKDVWKVAEGFSERKQEGVFVAADSGIPAEVLDAILPNDGTAVTVKLGAGEKLKQLSEVERLGDLLLDAGANRNWTLVAAGGGVLGDLGGLVASLFQRGVNLVQLPTTLVAQVDSAIGGKTGVNLAGGKNQMGTFYPAPTVLSDVGSLVSLPDREFRSGLAEVIKYAAVFSEDFFSYLEQVIDKVLVKDTQALFEVVGFCALQKQRCIHNDLEDRLNVRALLNFGHTYGHAIEKLSGYGALLHGEAVAIGMIQAVAVSAELRNSEVSKVTSGGAETDRDLERIARLLQRCLLPVAIPEGLLPKASSNAVGSSDGLVERTATSGNKPGGRPSLADWSAALRTDKKRSGNEVNFVVLEKLGSARVRRVSLERLVQRLGEPAL